MTQVDHFYDDCDPIAVIGLACRLPKANDVEMFWQNLLNGVSGQSTFTAQELKKAGISTKLSEQENFVPCGAIIDKPEYFDATLFGYSPQEARSIDPQQRLFLQTVWHAFEHAGYAPAEIDLKTGVFGSSRMSTYPSFDEFDVTQVGQNKGLQALIGNDKDYLATRVAHRLNLKGPALTIQTACSSSLVATHLACESLRAGECDMAVSGGVAISFPQQAGYQYQPGMIFSPDGLCRPFDQDANGTFGGNGVGAVVLKRLNDAMQDGDQVLAVIRGSAINNDGNDKAGFTAPSVSGQATVLKEALELANIAGKNVGMVEAHGTGTPLGDPVEITAIKQAYRRDQASEKTCLIGSLKSNLGHLDTAAGIASLIKTVLCVSRGKIPASLNIQTPNPELALAGSGFDLARSTQEWKESTRTAGVSSFGIGGTNCHMIVQSLPSHMPLTNREKQASTSAPSLLLSAATRPALNNLASAYANTLRHRPEDAENIAFTALHGRQLNLAHKLVICLNDNTADTLDTFATSDTSSPQIFTGFESTQARITWCFTGQGCQYVGMGSELYNQNAAFRKSIDLSALFCKKQIPYSLTDVLFGDKSYLLSQTDHSQLAIVAYEIAMAAYWLSKDIQPEFLIGHSVGEYAACVVGGYISHKDAIELLIHRGNLMHQCAQSTQGAMLAVFATPNECDDIAALRHLDIAAYNGSQHLVYSGPLPLIQAAVKLLQELNIQHNQLNVPCAAHSSLLDPILERFHNLASTMASSSGTIPLISTVTGKILSPSTPLSSEYWRNHLRKPVLFHQAINEANSLGSKVFMEMGPDAHLVGIGKREHDAEPNRWIATSKKGQAPAKLEQQALSELYVAGAQLNWKTLFSINGYKSQIPLYPFDEQRYWHTSMPQEKDVARSPTSFEEAYNALRISVIDSFFSACIQRSTVEPFSLSQAIRGARILPRYRTTLKNLLSIAVEHVCYSLNGKLYQRITSELATVNDCSNLLRDTLKYKNNQIEITSADITNLAKLSTELGPILTNLECIPSGLESNNPHTSLLFKEPQAYQNHYKKLLKGLPSYGGLSELNWSHIAGKSSFCTYIAQTLKQLANLSSEHTLKVNTNLAQAPDWLNTVIISQDNRLWGCTDFNIRAQTPNGHWQRIATATLGATKKMALTNELPSPQYRYMWDWEPIIKQQHHSSHYSLPHDSPINPIDLSDLHLNAIDSENQRLLVILPNEPLVTLTKRVLQALSSKSDHILFVTALAFNLNHKEVVNPHHHAITSLIRVARKETPSKNIYQLDVHEMSAKAIIKGLEDAPFILCSEIAVRQGQAYRPILAKEIKPTCHNNTSLFTQTGWHIVTGGMGGLGRLTLQWLIKQGATQIAVIARSQHKDWDQFIKDICPNGVSIITLFCDLSNAAELTQILASFTPNDAISGVIHAAGEARHEALSAWSEPDAIRLFNTKAYAADILLRWVESRQAEYLVLYSSAAVLGAPNQGVYAAANAYLDGLALANKNVHCHVVSIAWGAWEQVGMTQHPTLIQALADSGMHTLEPAEGLWHLGQAFMSTNSRMFAMNIDHQHDNFNEYLSSYNSVNLPLSLPKPNIDAKMSGSQIQAPKTHDDIEKWLDEHIRLQLEFDSKYALSIKQDLLQIGMDSLQFLELKTRIQKTFGLLISTNDAYHDLSIHGLTQLILAATPNSLTTTNQPKFTIDRLSRNQPFPLTPIQHAYWIGREPWVNFGGIACHVVFEWDQSKSLLDPLRLEQAWNTLIQHHDMLRMVVSEEGEQNILAKTPYYAFTQHCVRSLPNNKQQAALLAIRTQLSNDVRPANQWPLFEIAVTQISINKFRLHMNLDLLQFDVQSFKIMMDDWALAYDQHALPPLELSFKDYVLHEQTLRGHADWQNSWDYWQQVIPLLPGSPSLPTNPDYLSQQPEFTTLQGGLNKADWQRLKETWQQWGITPSAGLLTLFARVLAKWSTTNEFTLNMTFFNRQPFHPDVQRLIGDFTSVLLMDFALDHDTSLKMCMENTQGRLWQRLEHSRVNGVEVIRELARHQKKSGNVPTSQQKHPTTPIVFTSMLGLSMDGMNIEKAMTQMFGEPVFVLSQTPQVWLDHQVMEVDGALTFNWYCLDDIFAEGILEQLMSDYRELLTKMAHNPSLMQQAGSNKLLSKTMLPQVFMGFTCPPIASSIIEEVRLAWKYLESQALYGIWQTFKRFGLFSKKTNGHSLSEIRATTHTDLRHYPLLNQWLNLLCQEGIIHVNESKYQAIKPLEGLPVNCLPDKKWCQVISTYISNCVAEHNALLSGRRSALELLFLDDEITKSLYSTNPSLVELNNTAAAVIKHLASLNPSDFQILEVGAGTAATSQRVLEQGADFITRYQFTDISEAFLNDARSTLSTYHEHLEFGLFDINLPIETQNMTTESYDLILAVNVLHDATDLKASLVPLRSLLKQEGHLILVEATDQYSAMQLATVGFIEGINAFTDFRKEHQTAILTLPMWQNTLEQSGFAVELVHPQQEVSPLRQHLILAKNTTAELQLADLTPMSSVLEQVKPEKIKHNPIENTSLMSQTLVDEVRKIWQNLLNKPVIANTDFFADGGDSLLATRMLIEMHKIDLKEVSLQHIFEASEFSHFIANISLFNTLPIENDTEHYQTSNKHYPLTELQNAYWLGESKLFALGNEVAHFYAEIKIENFDLKRFTHAWNKLVQHHAQLRAVIDQGKLLILDEVPYYQLQQIDLSHLSEALKEQQIESSKRNITAHGVPTNSWPLFDISALKLSNNETLIHLVIDLVVADGKSLTILFQQLEHWYFDIEATIAPPRIDIKTYLEALVDHKNTDAYLTSKTYWFARIASLPQAPILPLSGAEESDLSQSTLSHLLCEHTWKSLSKKALQQNVLPSMAILTAFCQTLNQWSENTHFAISVLHSNRLLLQPESDDVVGNLSTTSILEVNTANHTNFTEFANQIQQQVASDLAHADFNGQEVLREKNRLDHNLNSGMPIVFNDTISVGSRQTMTLGQVNDFGAQTPHVYLDCMLMASPCGGIIIKWAIQRTQLKPGVFDAMFSSFTQQLIQISIENWQCPLRLPLPLEQQHRNPVNTTSSLCLQPFSADISLRTLNTMIEQGAQRFPHNIAIQQGGFSLSYETLWQKSMALTQIILAQNDPNPLIAIVMNKGWEQVVAVNAIILAGKAYMPIDATYPQSRIEALLTQASINTVLFQSDISLDFSTQQKINCLFVTDKNSVNENLNIVLPNVAPHDLAYVIFTSGSTGQPKGVTMDHQAVVNTLLDINQRLDLNESDRVLAISNLNFDLSVFDIFSTLSIGATLVIPNFNPSEEPDALAHLVEQERITVWNSVPAFAQILADGIEQKDLKIPSLKHIMMSGDWIPVDLPDRLFAIAPNANLLSLGGATEAAIWSISYPITHSCQKFASVPYGKPLTNQAFYILNQALQPCPNWVTGELYIGGTGLAVGYWDDDERTHAAFIHHPETQERLYKTGDLGRYLPDENIEFLGRNDQQVKINGYRIELGEIEHILGQYPEGKAGVGLKGCLIHMVKDPNHGAKLIGYLVLSQGNENQITAIESYLRNLLPGYMCPSAYVLLDKIPLSVNGKIDRGALPLPIMPMSNNVCTPETDTELALIHSWRQVLHREDLPTNSSFFDLGGNSLTAVRMISRINSDMRVNLTATSLQANDTIQLLAAYIDSLVQSNNKAIIDKPILLNPLSKSHNKLLFLVHPIGGHLLSYQVLAKHVSNIQIYGIHYPNNKIPDTSVIGLAQEYVRQIRQVQPSGPYHLAGWSFGGVVTYEMAYQLTCSGQKVTTCLLIDSFSPSLKDNLALSDKKRRELFYADCASRFPRIRSQAKPDPSNNLGFFNLLASQLELTSEDETTLVEAESLIALYHLYCANLEAMMTYQAPNSDIPVTLISATATRDVDFMEYQMPSVAQLACHGWSKSAPVTVIPMAGDHYTLFEPPYVNELANVFNTITTNTELAYAKPQ